MKYLDEARKMLGGGKLVGAKKDQLKTMCPFCRGNKFYFNVRTGSSSCKSGRCEKSFRSIYSFAKALDKVFFVPIKTDITRTSEFDPWRGEDKTPIRPQNHTRAWLYLQSRGVDTSEALECNIWCMKKSGTLIFSLYNFFNPEEQTPYYRRLKGELRWIGEPGFERVHHCFGGQWLKTGARSVVIVEGIFDLLTPGLRGYGISTLGAEISAYQMAFIANNFQKVYHLPDNDQGGVKCSIDLQKMCRSYGVEYVNYNHKGWLYENSDYKDPGDIPREHPKIEALRGLLDRENKR